MNNDLTAFEKIPVKIFKSSEDASVSVAKEIAALIKKRQQEGTPQWVSLVRHTPITTLQAACEAIDDGYLKKERRVSWKQLGKRAGHESLP